MRQRGEPKCAVRGRRSKDFSRPHGPMAGLDSVGPPELSALTRGTKNVYLLH